MSQMIRRATLLRLVATLLCALPAAEAARAEPGSTEAEITANQHFARAEAMTKAKGMHQFTKEDFDALLSEYEAGIEILITAAEKAPTGSKDALNLTNTAASRLRAYANHALRRYKHDWVFDYWDRIRSINKEASSEALFASAMALRAHGALASEDYNEAKRIFSEMAAIGKSGSLGKLAMESYHPEFYEKIARRAEELARNPVKPEYTVKVFSPRIGLLRFAWTHRLLSGETQEVKTSPLKLKKGDVELADLAEDSLRRTVLAMSDGKLDIVFDRLPVTDALTIRLEDGREIGNGVLQSPSTAGDDILDRAEGEVGELLRERVKNSDVVFLFWWGTSPLTQHGGMRTFKIPGPRRARGNVNIGVQFFHYDPHLDYMNCGACPGPNGIGFYPHVYMHEFFHVVEARFGIKPVHGFTAPALFPAWKGRDEVDYYWWQIRENIPALQKSRGKPAHWSEFTFM